MATSVTMRYKRYSALQYFIGASIVEPHPTMVVALLRDGFIEPHHRGYKVTSVGFDWMTETESLFPLARRNVA